MRKTLNILFLLIAAATRSWAQETPLEMKMDFEEYDPPSSLVVPEHKLTKAKFPFIDIHNHQFGMPTQDLKELLREMDKLNMAVMVNLSGRGRGNTDHLDQSLANVKRTNPSRLVVFTNTDFSGIDDPDWAGRMVKQLEEDVLAYLSSNYNKYELSLEQAAERFRLSVFRLSRLIKEWTGDTFTDYIVKMRISEVKRLLRETDLPIQQIVEAVGYVNVPSFTRKFKDMEGIAPGQFRKLSRKQT